MTSANSCIYTEQKLEILNKFKHEISHAIPKQNARNDTDSQSVLRENSNKEN